MEAKLKIDLINFFILENDDNTDQPGIIIIILIYIKIFSNMNLRTLEDMKKQKGGSNDDKKKKTTQSYTGGESSGMAVINPDAASLMEKAEKNNKSYEEFTKQQKEKDGNVCKITLYENGFQIDDGDFHDYSDPVNKQFLKQLNEGKIPKKLREKYPKGGLSVSLSDKTSEKYVPPPPPAYVAFSGTGTSLSEAKKPATKFAKKKGASQNFLLEPNRNKPVTTIQVRLLNGQRIPIEANLDTKVEDIYHHVATIGGVSQFELYGGYPPKPLSHEITVEQGDLADSTLIQRQ